LSFLSAIFLIFTAFELWKFAGTMDHGVRLLVEYLFFLLPFVYIQLAPSSAMISVLATYVVKSRQNEIVSWAAAGQSVYRLLLPSFVLMALLGLVNWEIQERILPSTNQTQEELRSKIRNLGAPTRADGRSWFATEKRIYTFTAPSENDKAENILTNPDSITPEAFASDNVKSALNVNVYQFNSDGTLQTVYRFPSANWIGSDVRLYGSGEKVTVNRGNLVSEIIEATSLDESSNPFAGSNSKPSELDSRELRTKLEFSGSPTEKRSLDVALQKKYATLVIPFVIALFTAPFSLSLNRRSRVVTVGYAVAVWLVFTASMSLFEQYGLSGNIDPKLAVWGPMAIFAVLGIFLLTKVRT
jgi:lipopolysaccharide export LptBFGC system permease protein LptF